MRQMMRRAMATMGEPETASDVSGWFTADGLARDQKYTLSLRKQGYVQQTINGVELPPVEPLQVVLEAASEISGVVLDDEGAPVVGATVELMRGEPKKQPKKRQRFVPRAKPRNTGIGDQGPPPSRPPPRTIG